MKLAIAVLALALLLPAAASAKPHPTGPLPDPEKSRITVPHTIGGVQVGQTLDEANKIWGGDGKCAKGRCHWGGNAYDGDGTAWIFTTDGVVDGIYIGYDDGLGKDLPREGVAQFKTKEGIGLSTPLADVKKAYPKATPIHKPSNNRIQAWKITGDEVQMVFRGGKRIESISVSAL